MPREREINPQKKINFGTSWDLFLWICFRGLLSLSFSLTNCVLCVRTKGAVVCITFLWPTVKVLTVLYEEYSTVVVGNKGSGGSRILKRGGSIPIPRCQRQCIEGLSGDPSAWSMEKIVRLHFSLIRMGSHGTFMLCTASSRCSFLLQLSSSYSS